MEGWSVCMVASFPGPTQLSIAYSTVKRAMGMKLHGWGEGGCMHMEGGVYMHGEREGVSICEGGVCMHEEREGVYMEGWSVRSWGKVGVCIWKWWSGHA